MSWLLPFAPRRDASQGGARVMAETIAALAAEHDLALLYMRTAGELPIESELAARCERVDEVVRGARPIRLGRQLLGHLGGAPLWVAHWHEPAYAAVSGDLRIGEEAVDPSLPGYERRVPEWRLTVP